MMIDWNQSLSRRAALAALGAAPLSLRAQSYPAHPVRWVVPFPPGGSLDTLGRAMISRLPPMGQPIVVDNKPGANTQLAASYVAKQSADGYTLLLATDAAFSIAPALGTKLPYDPEKDFIPISMLAQLSLLLVGHPGAPGRNLAELLTYAKANPGKLSYASLGVGSVAHVTAEALCQRAGIEMLHVPYQGIAPAVTALLSGEVDLLFAAIALPMPYLQSGKLKAYAYTGSRSHPLLPTVPSFTEAGLPGFESKGWFGMFAPAGTPASVIARWSQLAWATVTDADFAKTYLIKQGFEVPTVPPPQFGSFLRSDRKKWGDLVHKLGDRLRS